MFGYVTFYKDELKIKDFNRFRAYYCGLCKELGKRFNQLVRLGLSYDFTFLAILLDSVDSSNTYFEQSGCFKHFSKKKAVVKNNSSIQYAADMSVVFTYFKLFDDICDEKSPASMIAIVPYWFALKNVKRKYSEIISKIKTNLKSLSVLEKNQCGNIDEVSHEFAQIMESLFDFGGNELKQLGYNLGRFIYIADAVNDYEDDVKKNKYNPYRFGYEGKSISEIREIAGRSMTYTLARMSQNYENLKVNKNKELLDNIVYMGLRQRMDAIVCGEKCRKGRENGKSI